MGLIIFYKNMFNHRSGILIPPYQVRLPNKPNGIGVNNVRRHWI